MVFNAEQVNLLKSYQDDHQDLSQKERSQLVKFIANQFAGAVDEANDEGEPYNKKTLIPVSDSTTKILPTLSNI
jgi:hypothetical protein